MKKIIVLLLLLYSFSLFNMVSYSSDMLDVDYNFIDTAFDGIKPVTDKEFNDTVNRLTPAPIDNSFKGKLKTFLFGRKYGVTPAPQIDEDKKIDIGGEKKAIEDMKNGVFYIKLLVSIYDNDGNIIPLGNYKIQEKMIDNNRMLVFYQGIKEYGKLKLYKYEDNLKKENDINYSRLDIVNDNTIRLVYSTIQDTYCSIAHVYLQN